jgi:heat shock protein HslJ
MKTTIFILSILLSLQCSSKKISKQPPGLENTWTLEELVGFKHSLDGNKGRPLLKINLEEANYGGNSGCNSYSGKFRKSEKGIEFMPALMTKMACNDNGLERAYITALESATNYLIEENQLKLTSKQVVIAVFKLKEEN